MSWASLANNQTVSFNNLQDAVNNGVFTLKNTIPVSNKQTTKGEAEFYVNIDPILKANGQLVVKSNLVANTTSTTTTTLPCIGYELSANDGTGVDNPYSFTYTNCVGDPASGIVDNLGPVVEICALQGTVVPGSIYITVTEIGPCLSPITTTTTTTIYTPVGSTTPFTTVSVSRSTGQYQMAGNSNFNSSPWLQGYVFVSDNYGANWKKTSLFGFWQKVASSDNGQYMLAVEYYGKAYRSSNYGSTWTQITNFPFPAPTNPYGFPALQILNFRGAALSDNGQYQVISTSEDFYGSTVVFGTTVSQNFNTIFVSNDYGATWAARTYQENEEGVYNAVTISANGQTVLAAKGRNVFGVGTVLRSTNYGVTWSGIPASEASGNLVDIAILADGSRAISARFSNDYFPYLIASTDNGATWSNITGGGGAAQQQWTDVAINTIGGSASAFAISLTNSVDKFIQQVPSLTSVSELTSSGLTRWKSIANSNNGQYLLGGTTTGLYISTNSGASWSKVS